MKRITLFTLFLIYLVNGFAQPSQGLIASFPMSYDGTDIIGGYDALEIGIPPLPVSDRDGNYNCALKFDGNNYLKIPANAIFNATNDNAFSISLWFKNGKLNLGNHKQLFSKLSNKAPYGYDYSLSVFDIDKPLFSVNNISIWYTEDVGFIPDTLWHHVAGVYSAKKLKFYFDGFLIDSTNLGTYSIIPTLGDIMIGKDVKGSIDDIYYYNRAISSEEVKELFIAPACSQPIDSVNRKVLTGKVFYDKNGNNVLDTEDYYLSHFPLNLDPTGSQIITYESGLFYKTLENIVYNLEIPSIYSSLFRFSTIQLPIDLPNYTPYVYNLGEVGITTDQHLKKVDFTQNLPNQTARFLKYGVDIFFKNIGTEVLNGELEVTFHGKDLSINIDNPVSTINILNDSTQIVKFSISNLDAFQSFLVKYKFVNQSPSFVPCKINYDYTDISGFTFSDSSFHIATYPFDPNQISVNRKAVTKKYFKKQELLKYTIHFQNLGSAPARNVIIKQLLPSNLDGNSVVFNSSSDDVYLEIEDSNDQTELIWHFDDINLPQFRKDSLGSIGYVSFSILPIEIELGESIDLNAEIYFDHEDAILTNLANTTLTCTAPSGVEMIDISLFDALCFGDTTGGIILKSNIEEDELIIKINGINIQYNTAPFNFESGYYVIMTTDAAGCTQIDSITIRQPDLLTSSIIKNEIGQKELVVVGGATPYSILWDNNYTGFDLSQFPLGSYSYIITDANGCTQGGIFRQETLSEYSVIEDEMHYYPNPADKYLIIKWPGNSYSTEILDLQGNIKARNLNSRNISNLEVEALENGIYIIKLYSEKNGILIRKFVKI